MIRSVFCSSMAKAAVALAVAGAAQIAAAQPCAGLSRAAWAAAERSPDGAGAINRVAAQWQAVSGARSARDVSIRLYALDLADGRHKPALAQEFRLIDGQPQHIAATAPGDGGKTWLRASAVSGPPEAGDTRACLAFAIQWQGELAGGSGRPRTVFGVAPIPAESDLVQIDGASLAFDGSPSSPRPWMLATGSEAAFARFEPDLAALALDPQSAASAAQIEDALANAGARLAPASDKP